MVGGCSFKSSLLKGGDSQKQMNTKTNGTKVKVGQKSILTVLAFIFAGFQIYSTIFGAIPEIAQRAIHLGFIIIFLFFASNPISKKHRALKFIDWIFAAAGTVSITYLVVNLDQIARRSGISTTTDIVMGIILFIVILEGTRRSLGWPLVILSVFFIIYARFGTIFPGIFTHANFGPSRLVGHMYLSVEGIFGIPLSVSATYLYLFVLFGEFMRETGVADMFINFGLSFTGRLIGGQAKVAILSTALFGTVSGSSPAAVATTGAFTIPLMKRSGYSPEFAGAVESVAAAGGQIMPPVMGAAAFIMARYLNVPYSVIAIAGVVPALLYYAAAWIQVDFHSRKMGLKGMGASELPKMKDVLRKGGYMFLPLLGLIVMIVMGFSALYAAFWAIIFTILISLVKKDTRITWEGFKRVILNTAKGVAGISMATAICGVIVGVISLTGTALLLGNGIVSLANNNLIIVLILTMSISLLLGMGMPTSAAYIICATVAAPVIIRLGVPPLAAHMFVFYFSCMASITPPVAVASIVAAGIAGASFTKTGFLAFRLAICGFMVPFVFVYAPGLLLVGASSVWSVIVPIVTCFIGLIVLGASIEGYWFCRLTLWMRVILGVASVLLIIPETITDIVGIILFVAIGYYNWRMSKLSATTLLTVER